MDLGWNRLIHHPYKAVIRRHCDLGFVALRKVYQNSAQEPEFQRPNWFRTERTLKDVGSCLEDYLPAQVCTRSRIIELGRDVRFDPKTETFGDDKEANALLTKNYRAPYTLPEV
jgi:hypothetical protein